MSRGLSLRERIVLSYVLFAALISTIFAAGVYATFDALEDQFVEDTVRAELDEVIGVHRHSQDYSGLVSSHMRIYVSDTPSWDERPPAFRDLAEGVTELMIDDREYHVEVRHVDGRTYVMAFDETDIEQRQSTLGWVLLTGVLVCTFVGAWAGFAMSRRVIEPVSRLSEDVAALVRGGGVLETDSYADDEVGELARSFQLYQQRIHEFLVREREFTGNVSHELRTPLTSIRSAVEVALADPAVDGVQRERLLRMLRATMEMAQLIEIFLLLARAEEDAYGGLEKVPADVLSAVLQDLQPLAEQRGARLALRFSGEAGTRLNMGAFGIVARNLVQNAIVHGGGQVEVSLDADTLRVWNDGPPMSEEALKRAFERHYRGAASKEGAGLGLAIARRLADRFGWSLELDSDAQGTLAILRLRGGRRLDEGVA
ncbi:MAG TPA: HAMP domain-containing sensor histidine kinase [Gammaproteobacteria bacterium]|nr:HAMP domain-containing sensor histidine kinase [Gammaproteobacteria bacterium]